MHYYKHHLGDYARDTVGLSLIEHGAYRLLIDAYYSSESAIDQEEAYAITKAGTAVEKKAVDRVLSKYFHRQDGFWVHNRIDREVEEYQRKATVNATNGAHGGRPKTNRNINPDETGSVISGLVNGNPNQNPDPPPEITLASNHKPVTNKKLNSCARASRLPEDWALPEDWKSWALSAKPNWPEAWVQRTADDFRDYWLAAPKGTKLDWLATWRKWVRNANDPGKDSLPARPWEGAK